MDSARGRRIEQLYQLALDCEPSARRAFLDEACQGDEDLRREVASLLEQQPTRTVVGPRTELGIYRIEEPLGQGGMGVVYRALDTKLNRPVAIKFLSEDLADSAARRRFQREAQLASSLNHPHILTVYDAGEFEGRQYLVTEFVDGGTLKDWARSEQRTWKQIVDLLTGVADGLAVAHAAAILHRDIKPDNVLVARNGYAKLADFGLAKLTEGDAASPPKEGQTRPGAVLGTIAYMSPEQASGKPLDARSDIFSFGAMLYEMLAGRRPFTGGSDLEVLKSIVHAAPAPLDQAVPLALRMIVEKALEKDPAERYQSMREMVVDLKRLARQKIATEPPAAAGKAHRTLWPWAAVGVLLVGVLVWEWARPTPAPANPLASARFMRLTDFEGLERDAAISPDGKFVALLSNHDGPFDIWLRQVGVGPLINLTQGKIPDLPAPLRTVGFSQDGSEIWIGGGDVGTRLRLMPLTGGAPRNFLAETVVNPAWSLDGTRMAYHTRDPGDPIFVADRAGGNPRRIFIDRPGMHNHFLAWSPDGRWIYFAHGTPDTKEMDLWRIASAGGEPERLTQLKNDVAYVTPIDSHTVLFVARDENGSGPWLWAFDLERNSPRRVSFGLEQYTSVAASADGRRLVATVANPKASLWSVPILERPAEERDVQPFQLPVMRALAPRFGGTALFYLSSRGAADGLWRYQDGQALEIWKGSDGALMEPGAISPDGRRVAIVLRRGGKKRLHVLSADGAGIRSIAESLDVQGAACWSPDGQWIVTGGNDAAGPGLFKIPMEHGAPVRLVAESALDPVWSPDGSLIAYAGANLAATTTPLLAVRPDGSRVELPAIAVRRQGERARFLPSGKGLIYMQRLLPSQDFWLLDLTTMKSRPLTRLTDRAAMRTFDVTPDGKQIVFDRLRDNSDIVLIDLPK